MAKGCSWPFQQELLQGMPCCDLCVTVVLPSASICVLVQLRGQSSVSPRGWLCSGRCLSSANVNVVFLTRKSLDPASGTPGVSNELLHLQLM